jgi:Protein of unknown function (DUF3987)
MIEVQTSANGAAPVVAARPQIDPAAFYGLAGRLVAAIAPHSEADPVALLVHIMIFFGNCAGRAVHMEVDGARHGLNEFAVFVGPTSKGRKGTARRRVERFFYRVDSDWVKERIVSGLASGEGMIHAVRDPVQGVNKAGDAVVADLGVQDKRLMIVEEEFASVIAVCQRERCTLSSTIRMSWDSGTLRNLSKHSPEVATGAHISIIGHITVDELVRTLDSTQLANGVGNRHLWLYVQRSKELPFGGDLDESDLNRLVMEFCAALDEARKPKQLVFAPAAADLWRASLYHELSADRLGLLGAITARAEAHVLRLSCIYAALDRSREVKLEHLVAASALWAYVDQSCKFIWGDMIGDADADALRSMLQSQPNGLSRTEISNLLGRNLSAARIERALGTLLRFGLARFETIPTSGRSAERWFAIKKQ